MIKNIIFDFGDIFINLDKQGTYKELAKLGILGFSDEMLFFCKEYEKGLLTTDAFLEIFQLKFNISKEDLIFAWNAVLLDFTSERFRFIKNLASSNQYRLFLLSNTNELHISWIQENWGMELFDEFKQCFENFYLSQEINLRKPDKEIYEFVLNENNLAAGETLFIDDLKENTTAAKELGIQVWNLKPGVEDVINLADKIATL